MVSCDELGLIQCRNLDDGRLRWSYPLSGAVEIIAESGKVLVHRAATYERGVPPTTVVLDLEKGTELLRLTPTNNLREASAFFDGTNIDIETGAFDDAGSDFEPDRLAVWNLKGQETGSIPIPPAQRDGVRDGAFSNWTESSSGKDTCIPDGNPSLPTFSRIFGRLDSDQRRLDHV